MNVPERDTVYSREKIGIWNPEVSFSIQTSTAHQCLHSSDTPGVSLAMGLIVTCRYPADFRRDLRLL